MRGTMVTAALVATAVLGAPGPAAAQPAEPVLQIVGRSVAEDAAVLPFAVYLSESSSNPVTFDYATVDDTATAGSDYDARSGSYEVDPGVVVGPLPVTVLDDTVAEPDERFRVEITNVVGAVYDASGSDPYGVILDDDDPPPPTPSPSPSLPADTTPPIVSPPGTDFALGARLRGGLRPIPLAVTFSASDPSGISATGLQQRSGRRTYADVRLLAADALPATVRVSQDDDLVHRFRSRATDTLGNTSPWATARAFRVLVRQDGSRAIRQAGPWTTKRSRTYFGGTARAATRRGAKQKLTARGTDFAIVATRGPDRGKAHVLLDGRRVATVDLYARRTKPRSIVHAVSFPSTGRHTIALWASGTRNDRSRGKRVDLDAFLVLRHP